MRSSRFLAFLGRPFVLLGVYIFLSAMLMNLSDSASLRGIRWAVLQTVGLLNSIKAELAWQRNLEQENELLKKENFRLHLEYQKLRETILENARLKELLKMKESSPDSFITAQVIAFGTENRLNTRVLNVGYQGGVEKNMAVVNADGLVGKVIETTADYSIVQILTDHDCWVGAQLQMCREVGIIGWDGNPWLNLYYIPKNIAVQEGEWVLTSGLSKIYPPGLKIGAVAKVDQDENELFKKIRIKPAVNFNSIEEVFVIRTATRENSASE